MRCVDDVGMKTEEKVKDQEQTSWEVKSGRPGEVQRRMRMKLGQRSTCGSQIWLLERRHRRGCKVHHQGAITGTLARLGAVWSEARQNRWRQRSEQAELGPAEKERKFGMLGVWRVA